MNRKIAALALAAATVLLGACGGDDQSSDSTEPLPSEPTTTWSKEDLALVEVNLSKPAPNAPKVDPASLPEELATFTAVHGLSEQQQACITGSIKQTLDADPSLKSTPGKQASLSSTAMAQCDGAYVFTDPLVEGVAAGEADPSVKLTAEQTSCFKQAFASDKQATAKVIAQSIVSSHSGEMDGLQQALAPFEQKCGAKIGNLASS
jgi:hypothetical protein